MWLECRVIYVKRAIWDVEFIVTLMFTLDTGQVKFRKKVDFRNSKLCTKI